MPQRHGRRKGAARTLEVVSPLRTECSLASSCANAEIASTSSESSTSRITVAEIASTSSSLRLEWGRLQSYRTFLAKWQSEVFNQTHRWTKESVSGKARMERRLVTVHHGETGRNFNEERVLSVDRADTLRFWAAGAFWCDSLSCARSHVAKLFRIGIR